MNTIYNQLKESPFMEKKIILLMLMALFSMFANAQQISYIKADGAWVKTYDINGKKICTLSKQTVGEVIGVSGNTFTSRQSAWIYIWNKEGKKLQTRSA